MSKPKDKTLNKSTTSPLNPFQTPLESLGTGDNYVDQASQDAVKTSKQIDQYLLEGKKEIERRRKAIKILLLGEYLDSGSRCLNYD